VQLGGASGGTEVTAVRLWRVGQRYYIATDTCLYIFKASYPLKEANVIAAKTIVTKMAILSAV